MRRSRTKMVMDTIKWVNDTFVPRGLKPIEDLMSKAIKDMIEIDERAGRLPSLD